MKTSLILIVVALGLTLSACDSMDSGSTSHPYPSPTAQNGAVKGAPTQPSSSAVR